MPWEMLVYAAAVLSLGAFLTSLAVWVRLRATAHADARLERLLRDESSRGREEAGREARLLREEMAERLSGFQDSLLRTMAEMQGLQKAQLETFASQLRDQLHEGLSGLDRRVEGLIQRIEQTHEALRKGVEERLDTLRIENAQKLEQMRHVVDEKLQGTLERRLGESFKLVSERLEQVHRGLGEMQTLANGVGDLKRVLSNVKTRGTWGEVQLGTLLEQMLTQDQIARNVATRPNAAERVEFAIRLPGSGINNEKEVLLPIDAKFPQADYERLLQAVDRADMDGVENAAENLENSLKASARDINNKYLHPPHTTDFAILFLPTEGLYAEALRRPGLADYIQREYRVVIAGPTTLSAILNALQMGFRTLTIEKRSSEVWQVLGAVRTEFGRYGTVLEKVQKKLQEASNTLDTVAQRRRAVDRCLRDVETLPLSQADDLLGLAVPTPKEDEPEP
ncbi:MAG: DNA recombination protein RmuC [Rhodospirillaceae bacterium]|nr:MAG: DNA recombination protein RmuC [Rhodospirillaceae bacterium]